jgi:DNA-binding FadR family transcriptional regulator
MISRFMKIVVGYSNQRLWRAMRESSYRYSKGLANRYLVHHERTYACLVSGDGDGAAQSMREHLEASEQAALTEMDAIGSRES